MVEDKGTMTKIAENVRDNPEVDRLRAEATNYAMALGRDLSGRLQSATQRLQEQAESGGGRSQGSTDGIKEKARDAVASVGAALGTVRDKVKAGVPRAGGDADPAEDSEKE